MHIFHALGDQHSTLGADCDSHVIINSPLEQPQFAFPGHLSPSERQSKPTFQLACQLDDCGPSKGFRLLLDNINHDHVHWTSIF
ncbi:hypothetical protein T4B_11927 [Trichinella pseudospiralis]|uniref:Uncharacterized protein n=1 Tax=Trichinella pseudospiralis TaxID=6337 RepID=A0A0V1IWS5_TRIPS|nr:hypothetical protein T4B_11927 [Trichinella pseudospiralis]